MKIELSPVAGTVSAVLDLVEIGPSVRLERITPEDLDLCRHTLMSSGVLDARLSATRGTGWMVLNLRRYIDGVLATAVADLNVAPAGEKACQITQRSTLRLNPLSYLADRGFGNPLGATYDRNSNYIGPTPQDCRSLIELQCRYAAEMIEELSRCLGEALPNHVVSSEERTRLRRIELCRDIEVSDSLGVALLLSHSVLRETQWVERDVYRAGSADDQGSPVTRWWRNKKGVAYKVYAKAPSDFGQRGCVREEVSCQSRKALAELECDLRADWSGEGLTTLLIGFVAAAMPLLETLHSHVGEVIAGVARPSDLFVALSPLVLPMSGAPTGGRPTSPEQVAMLRHAFDSLVLTGRYRGKGLKKGLSLRSLLDSLCSAQGPLTKHASLCLYMVKPQFVRASHSLAVGNEWCGGAERVNGQNS